MKNFDITDLRDGSGLALVMADPAIGRRSVAVYRDDELYPLRSKRYHRQLPNLFVDILDIIDGYGPMGVDADRPSSSASSDRKEVSAALSAPQVSLRTLVRRAQRAVQDGSGTIGHRYHDALDLWEHMAAHALASVCTPSDPPITDVRKSHNWRKQQPHAQQRANPAAWFVANVYSRSNAQKDAITAYRGLTAVLESLCAKSGENATPQPADRPDARALWRAATGNLDFPTYKQVAGVLGDSNMLVFHSDASFAQWIRTHDSDTGVRTGKSEMGTSTPVNVIFRTARGIRIVPGDTHPPVAGFEGLTSGQQISVANLANRMSPRD